MTNFDRDDLPPELSALGRRLRDQRPVAGDEALSRMMDRASMPSRQEPRRAPRRALAVSLASMVAMLSVTGVAAATLFGMSFPTIGHALLGSTHTTSRAALIQPASSSSRASRLPGSAASRIPSRFGSFFSGTASSAAALAPNPMGGAAGVSTNAVFPGLSNLFNAGFFQYGPGRLICRILRFFGLNRIANLLGCPP